MTDTLIKKYEDSVKFKNLFGLVGKQTAKSKIIKIKYKVKGPIL